MSFARDLAKGEEAERNVSALLLQRYPTYALIGIGERAKGYDLRFSRPNREDALIEVKLDRKGSESCCVYVETYCSDVGSGITTTEASHWVFFVEYEGAYLTPVRVLRDAIRHVGTTTGGDGGRARGKLLPLRTLRAISIRL